jgi:ppGpp synthetase/RelA/SpoT-type nucleotidyltranferase
MQNGEYVIIDNKTHKIIDRKPKNWKQKASFEIIKDRLKSENSITNKMLTLL